jgi:acetyl esterase/lipase
VKTKLALLGCLILVGASVSAQELDSVAQWAAIAATEYEVIPNIVYTKASGYDIKLDVILAGPRSQVKPTLIHIHGGGWVIGTKETSALAGLPYLARGMNIVNVEYRLSNVALAPAAVEDCRCALRWVYHNAKDYGFDTNRLVVSGESAGGHLALMTGMLNSTAGFDNVLCGWWPFERGPFPVAAVVNYFGITDVTDLLDGLYRQDYAVAWFGSLPNRLDLARRLSPVTYVRTGLPPILTLHGDEDTIAPYQDAVRLHEALQRAGVPNQLFIVRGGKHGGWTRDQNLKAQEAVFRFLEDNGILRR